MGKKMRALEVEKVFLERPRAGNSLQSRKRRRAFRAKASRPGLEGWKSYPHRRGS